MYLELDLIFIRGTHVVQSAGVRFMGFTPTLEIMAQYKVLLAPLRYGAGLKGKVVDAWWHGLPVVTTPIGSEGMLGAEGAWGGMYAANGAEEVARHASQLYSDDALWHTCQRKGFDLLSDLYDRERNLEVVHVSYSFPLHANSRLCWILPCIQIYYIVLCFSAGCNSGSSG